MFSSSFHNNLGNPVPSRYDKYKLFVVKAFLWLQNATLNLLVWVLYRKKSGTPQSILIFRTGSLGDNICAAPAIAAIRQQFPKAHITILTDASTAYAVSIVNVLQPQLYDEIIDYLGMDKKQLIQILKQKKFDLVIQLPQREAAFKRLVRDIVFFRIVTKTGWGWKVSTVRYFKKTQEKFSSFLNETARLIALLKENHLPVAESYSYALNITPADQAFVDEMFMVKQLTNKSMIAVVVGAQRPLNRWPISYFKEVIETFAKQHLILLIGGKGDLALVKSLELIPGVVNLCGAFTPMQSAVALSKCRLTLSNDTGPMHLSYAVGTPVIGLFSSRDFAGKWYPPADNYNKTFRTENVHCSICFSETCANNICMQAIKPRMVVEAIFKLLANLPVKSKRHITGIYQP